jgi:hypothetical protein
MSHRKLFMATAAIAAVVTTACSDMTAPNQAAVSFAQSGTFRVAKNCSSYQGQPGQSCTITSSTLNLLRPGSTITYTSGVGENGVVITEIVVDATDHGNNVALGHCTVDLRFGTAGYGTGICELTGGTGKFKGIHAHADVSPLLPFEDLNFQWVGSYSFSK